MTYPPAPWHTHGRAFIQPYLVQASSLSLPDGFRPVTLAGRCVGILALIQYVPPSPLTYAELAWMPCLVSARGVRGYYIEKMYVDSEASVAGGRELWAIPKQLARFAFASRGLASTRSAAEGRSGESIDDNYATIDTEDGAHVELSLFKRGPSIPLRAGAGTVQDGGTDLVRFRGRGTARTASGGLAVRTADGLDAWNGWRTATRLPGLGAALTSFEITMLPPVRRPR
ncbi:MAG: acetoacetate decarboxylase family protein [Kofleriaceae bacterium]|nr:acetoacetate decarboxylase family protein [Kofleriaceae bacterium]